MLREMLHGNSISHIKQIKGRANSMERKRAQKSSPQLELKIHRREEKLGIGDNPREKSGDGEGRGGGG